MRSAWYAMGRFWYAKHVPLRIHLLVFQARVQATGLSGLEAFIPSARDYKLIDGLVLQWGRTLLKGAAVLKIPQADGSLKHISLPAVRIWTKLGLVPSQLELRMRRLHWLQEIAAHRSDNKQLLTAIIGQMEGEEHPTCENSLLTRDNAGQ
eukprot:6119881-Pyramimonas_sp.AAC.1